MVSVPAGIKRKNDLLIVNEAPIDVMSHAARGYECAVHIPHLNDFNLDLTEMRKGRSPEGLDRQRESELMAEFEREAIPAPQKEADYEMEA